MCRSSAASRSRRWPDGCRIGDRRRWTFGVHPTEQNDIAISYRLPDLESRGQPGFRSITEAWERARRRVDALDDHRPVGAVPQTGHLRLNGPPDDKVCRRRDSGCHRKGLRANQTRRQAAAAGNLDRSITIRATRLTAPHPIGRPASHEVQQARRGHCPEKETSRGGSGPGP